MKRLKRKGVEPNSLILHPILPRCFISLVSYFPVLNSTARGSWVCGNPQVDSREDPFHSSSWSFGGGIGWADSTERVKSLYLLCLKMYGPLSPPCRISIKLSLLIRDDGRRGSLFLFLPSLFHSSREEPDGRRESWRRESGGQFLIGRIGSDRVESESSNVEG